MSDLISRQDTIDRINEYIEEYSEIDSDGNHSEKWCAMQETKMTIENMPSAQPERMKGKWIEENRRPKSMMFYCSECHRTAYDPQNHHGGRKRCRYAFCPNCGAEMLERRDDG